MSQTCKRCNETKELTEFQKNSRNKSGLMYQCRACLNAANLLWYEKNKAKARENGGDWDKENKATRAQYKRKYRYGVTDDILVKMHLEQDSKCAICLVSGEELVIDHCHASGEVRGLLCRKCNMGLGSFRDNPVFLTQAAKYVGK